MKSKYGFNKDGFELQGREIFQGLVIDIENKKGSSRHWTDENTGEKGSNLMHYDYGYVQQSLGMDQDEVDVYLGPDAQAKNAYVIAQMKKPDFVEVDEQKVMLGFSSQAEAKAAYIKQYDNPKFYGGMVVIPMDEFKDKINRYRGTLIKSVFLLLNNTPESARLDKEFHFRKSNEHMDELLKSLTPAERFALSRDPNVLPLGNVRVSRSVMAHNPDIVTARMPLPGEPPVVPVRRVETPHSQTPLRVAPEAKHSYPVNKPLDQSAKEYFRR